MSKYYVKSGQLHKIVIASAPVEAAQKALNMANGEIIDHFFFVDERGFRGPDLNKYIKGDLPQYSIPKDRVYCVIGEDTFLDFDHDENNI